ncbi:hypothetical protein ACFL20_09750 [Spirochaetota bacterium]
MTQGESNTVDLKELLSRYELQSPVPVDFQEYISSEMGSMFKRILKRAGQYSLVYGIFIALYFFLKKYGIKFTLTRLIVSLVTTAAIVTGSFYVYIKVIDEKTVDTTETMDLKIKKGLTKTGDKTLPKIKSIEKKSDKKTGGIITYTVGIEPFISSSLDKKTLKSISSRLKSEFVRMRGLQYSKAVRKGYKKNIKYTLLGSAEKMGDTVIIFAKVIDTKNSAILFATKEKALSIKDINKACSKISRRVVSKIE